MDGDCYQLVNNVGHDVVKWYFVHVGYRTGALSCFLPGSWDPTMGCERPERLKEKLTEPGGSVVQLTRMKKGCYGEKEGRRVREG